jgi:uncharacterized repeat protein (TIGR03806 family)
MNNITGYMILAIIVCGGYNACNPTNANEINVVERTDLIKYNSKWDIKPKLSDYHMFQLPLRNMKPNADVFPYELTSELFSDYAQKKRFIYLPSGTHMTHRDINRSFDFPDKAIIFKFFYYPYDDLNINGQYDIIETRVLYKKKGKWEAYSYVWNDEQTDAYLQLAGDTKNIKWTDKNGKLNTLNYSIPNSIQCKTCHEHDGDIIPIGPATRHLAHNKSNTTLESLVKGGKLKGVNLNDTLTQLVDYTDKMQDLNNRARSYLDINCAHCHQPHGSARNSALNLLYTNDNLTAVGIYKTPIAAGNGSGGLYYDIVPGRPKESILHYRMNSAAPGIAMPEVGRKTIHKEGVALIEEWIYGLDQKVE